MSPVTVVSIELVAVGALLSGKAPELCVEGTCRRVKVKIKFSSSSLARRSKNGEGAVVDDSGSCCKERSQIVPNVIVLKISDCASVTCTNSTGCSSPTSRLTMTFVAGNAFGTILYSNFRRELVISRDESDTYSTILSVVGPKNDVALTHVSTVPSRIRQTHRLFYYSHSPS